MHGTSLARSIVGVDELKARWAYAELDSSRFGRAIRSHLSGDVLLRAAGREPFNSISRGDWPRLVSALHEVRSPPFVDQMRMAGGDIYEAVDWHPSDLLSCMTLPVHGGYAFFRFLALPPHTDKFGGPRWDDPRHVAAGLPFDENFVVADPIIVIRYKGKYVLLEGYLRAIIWLRNPTSPLRVWIPRD